MERAIRQYQNSVLESAQVIDQLIEIARKFQEAQRRGQELGLSEDEMAVNDTMTTLCTEMAR